MNAFGAAIPFPTVAGETTRAKSKLDHRSTEEAALVRRVQAEDEMAFREVVERYQAEEFFPSFMASCAIVTMPRISPSRSSRRSTSRLKVLISAVRF